MTESIGFIFAGIARLMRRRFDEMSRDTGITRPQWRVLVSVHCNPGINQGTLADMLDVEPITTCRVVERLEQAGLVESRHAPRSKAHTSELHFLMSLSYDVFSFNSKIYHSCPSLPLPAAFPISLDFSLR